MADPFVGEIRAYPYNFAPEGWLACEGQVVMATQYQALYALIGNTFGGDAGRTFQLPDLRGYTAMGSGMGPGLSMRYYGKKGGSKTAQLPQTAFPAHTHSLSTVVVTEACSSAPADATTPVNGIEAANKNAGDAPRFLGTPPAATMKAGIISIAGSTDSAGSGVDHNNQMPFLAIGYFIATMGVFPMRQ